MEGRCDRCGDKLPMSTGWDGNGSFIHEYRRCPKCHPKLRDIKSGVIVAMQKQKLMDDQDIHVEVMTSVLLENGWILHRKETVYTKNEGKYATKWETLHILEPNIPEEFVRHSEDLGYKKLDSGIITTESIFAGL